MPGAPPLADGGIPDLRGPLAPRPLPHAAVRLVLALADHAVRAHHWQALAIRLAASRFLQAAQPLNSRGSIQVCTLSISRHAVPAGHRAAVAPHPCHPQPSMRGRCYVASARRAACTGQSTSLLTTPCQILHKQGPRPSTLALGTLAHSDSGATSRAGKSRRSKHSQLTNTQELHTGALVKQAGRYSVRRSRCYCSSQGTPPYFKSIAATNRGCCPLQGMIAPRAMLPQVARHPGAVTIQLLPVLIYAMYSASEREQRC